VRSLTEDVHVIDHIYQIVLSAINQQTQVQATYRTLNALQQYPDGRLITRNSVSVLFSILGTVGSRYELGCFHQVHASVSEIPLSEVPLQCNKPFRARSAPLRITYISATLRNQHIKDWVNFNAKIPTKRRFNKTMTWPGWLISRNAAKKMIIAKRRWLCTERLTYNTRLYKSPVPTLPWAG